MNDFLTQYLPPLLAAAMVALGLLVLILFLANSGNKAARRIWGFITLYRGALAFLFLIVLFIVAFATFLVRLQARQALARALEGSFDTPSNLITERLLALNPLTHTMTPAQPPLDSPANRQSRLETVIQPAMAASSNVIIVRPGEELRLGLFANSLGDAPVSTQVRLLWFGAAINLVSYDDQPVWPAEPLARAAPDEYPTGSFHTESLRVPEGVTRLQVEVRNLGSDALLARKLQLAPVGVYVEPHPNGAAGSLAFSFDWESAMGGAIHSKGDESHDVAGAEQHGLDMREGAAWLAQLFATHSISATFYATGYNLIDGNTERRTFNGDPTYKWASPKNGWASEHWLQHPWFSDDPFGTYRTHPAWYFLDQTRALVAAGHEIAPHTFAHIYVRGANPAELAVDLDEWISAARQAGLPPPATFAFPWRSSNSLTADFYDVLASRGIRAVTRIYPLDMKDGFTLGNALVYTDVRQPQIYPGVQVMPDFLLGSPSTAMGEESGAAISTQQGMEIIAETIARRGTTSFWQHPEQLAADPSFAAVRATWSEVVQAAARERTTGRLWIGTVAEITTYQRDVMSVTATLKSPGAWGGGWRLDVRNDSGREIRGLTLTLPGEAQIARDPAGTVRSVLRTADGVRISPPGSFEGPSRQIVLETLAPGLTTIEIEWEPGQEPPR